jgi:hypothetical protein
LNSLNFYLNDIPENNLYSILPILKWKLKDGDYKSITISKSIKLTRFSSPDVLLQRLILAIRTAVSIYVLNVSNIDLLLIGRPWLSADDFTLPLDKISNILDNDVLDQNVNSINIKNNYSDKVKNLLNYEYKIVYMDNYGEPQYDFNRNLIGYLIHDTLEYCTIETYYNDNNLLCNKVLVKEFDWVNYKFKGDTLVTWTDVRTDQGFTREYNNKRYYYDNSNNLINFETTLNSITFPTENKDKNLNYKIGTIDFETYGESNSGLGVHQVYAAGFSVKNKTELYYIEPNETSEQFVNRFFKNILNNNKLNNYTIYAHNLGRFDSLFIIKSLVLNKDIKISPIWKDNSILSLTINYLNIKFIILDSIQLIPGSLDSLLKSFNSKFKKGYFPYSFVNPNNLFYIGDKPNKEFYKNISEPEYNLIPINNWDLKNETLNYLKSDVEGLLDIVIKFNNYIFSKYQLDITKFKTLPGLILAAYRSSYLPNNLKSELKMVKGELEKEFRSAYFGGNVDVFINDISNGYLYDMNSQYPKAMLNDMPVGSPILSLETNLNNIFGFVFGEITCPNENELQVPFIQYRDPIDNTVSCPRGKFNRLIFSQEIKYALKYGYKINIKYCYQFKRGKNLFNEYVNEHYKIKEHTNDPIQRKIAKLFLNSLYGRLGMKELEDIMKIVTKREADYLDKNTNVSIISELSENKYLIKYSGLIDDNIRKLYKKDPLIVEKNKTEVYSKSELRKLSINKKRAVPSAVHIAAAISSYARILINEYKNIPGNPCIMSDTDSVVLTKPLPDHQVGGEIGQMRLEQGIKQGIFIRKKLYCILNYRDQEVVKSSGLDSDKLNLNSFLELLNGKSLNLEVIRFNVEWENLNINVINSNVKLQGLTSKIKTIYNTNDVNFKFISFPIKYNVIDHPLFPFVTEVDNKTNKINITQSDHGDSDKYLLFSKSEITLFIVTLSISIIFLIIYILFYK